MGTVSDSIRIALHSTLVVALIADRFWAQSALVARSFGLADVPRVQIPYPIAGSGNDNMRRVANDIVADVLRALSIDQRVDEC